MRFTYSWDVGVAFRLARILRTDTQLTESQVAYLSRYPNTHPLVSVHRAAYAVADATGLATSRRCSAASAASRPG